MGMGDTAVPHGKVHVSHEVQADSGFGFALDTQDFFLIIGLGTRLHWFLLLSTRKGFTVTGNRVIDAFQR
jgi:hypothetical protein